MHRINRKAQSEPLDAIVARTQCASPATPSGVAQLHRGSFLGTSSRLRRLPVASFCSATSKVPEPPSRKAQAAIEFLITNGWAILVVLILLAVLFYIGVLSPQNTTPNTCLFQPGFSCYTFKVGNETGSLELDFGQATGKSIQVTGISCSQNSTAALHTSPLNERVTVPSGEHRWITGGNSINTGITCEGATGEAGARYKGTACVSYTESGTNTQRLVCGEINARLEPASIPRPTSTPTPTPIPTPTPSCSGTCVDGVCNGCGVTISSGSWVLNDNIVCGDCDAIHVTGSRVTLDCQGHSITCAGAECWRTGIYLNGVSLVTVKNCKLSRFSYGISLYQSNWNNITDNTVTDSSLGIFLGASARNNFTGNNLSSNNDGIALWYSNSNNFFADNTACSNYALDVTCDSDQVDGGGNVCRPEGANAVCHDSVNCSAGCPPLQPPACAPGYVVSQCPCTIGVPGDYTLQSNLNSSYGCISFTERGDNSTLDCRGHSITCTNNCDGVQGISLGGSGVTVKNCNVSNFADGIVLQGGPPAGNNTIEDNTVDSNSNIGIHIYSASYNNTITGNKVCWNMNNFDCFAGQTDGGGNACNPEGESVCSDSFTCNSGCPPPAPPACAPGFVVSECPCTIAVPGDYTLNRDLVATENSCITMASGASGSTIDCQHHSITCNASDWCGYYGILLSNVGGATLKDCNVSGFYDGIYLSQSNGNNITNNIASSNNRVSYGIILQESDENILTGNNASSNHNYGIQLSASSNNVLTGNNASSNGDNGIRLESSSEDNNLIGNTATNNTNYDFYCAGGNWNNDLGNTCGSQTYCGSWLYTCPGTPPPITPTLIDHCPYSISSRGSYYLNSSIESTATCITISSGGSGSTLDCQYNNITGPSYNGGGVIVDGTHGVTVENCNLTGLNYGILLNNAVSSTIVNNTVDSNLFGIYLYGSRKNALTGNNVDSNVYYGFYLDSSNSNDVFTGNTASSNTPDFFCGDSSVYTDSGNTCGTQTGCDGWLTTCPAPTP